MKSKVYKILTAPEWSAFQEKGHFKGSNVDLADGFIHLSTQEQVAGVIERYFSALRPLYVTEFSNRDFIQKLRWEAATSGDIYPHFYGGELSLENVSNVSEFTAYT